MESSIDYDRDKIHLIPTPNYNLYAEFDGKEILGFWEKDRYITQNDFTPYLKDLAKNMEHALTLPQRLEAEDGGYGT